MAKTAMPAQWQQITWNPPLHRGAAGAFIGDSNGDGYVDDGRAHSYRSEMLGTDSYQIRQFRKGVIFQHTAYTDEWAYPAQSTGNGSYAAGTGRDKNRYGFRFHYNPSTIRYGVGVSSEGINPAIIMSGAGQSKPIAPMDGGATIGFSFYLNRIEDMLLLSPKSVTGNPANDAYQAALRAWQKKLNKAYARNDLNAVVDLQNSKPKKSQFTAGYQLVVPPAEELRYFYGQTMSKDDLDGIYQRGTGYDLEFLFRSLLGKPWQTMLRGSTADVGIAFGVPLILDFNAGAQPGRVQHGQRYLGRCTSISYNHLSFNRRMVPMWTEVALDFERYPDVAGAGAGSTVGTSNYSDASLNSPSTNAADHALATAPSAQMSNPDFNYTQYSAYQPMTAPGAGVYTGYGYNYGVGANPNAISPNAPYAGPYTGYGANYGYNYDGQLVE